MWLPAQMRITPAIWCSIKIIIKIKFDFMAKIDQDQQGHFFFWGGGVVHLKKNDTFPYLSIY